MTLGRTRVGRRRRRFLARLSLCTAAVGLTLGSTALAQSPAPLAAHADLSEQAARLAREGDAAARQGQWDKARMFYLSAWQIERHWRIAGSLGRAELKVGKPRDAAEHLAFALDEASKLTPKEPNKLPLLAQTKAELQDLLAQAKSQVATLTITLDPRDAELFIDNGSVGKAPLQGAVFVEPGERTVEARLDGYTPAKETRAFVAGGEVAMELRLVKEPAKGVVAEPPLRAPEATGGGPNKAIWIPGAAVAGAAAGLGVGFLVAWQRQPLYLGQYCNGYCTHYKNLTFWSFLGAGLIGGATGIYVLTASRSKNGVVATVAAGPEGGGLVVTGRW